MSSLDIKWRKIDPFITVDRFIQITTNCQKVRMRNLPKIITPREDTYSDTCSGDSQSLSSPKKLVRNRRRQQRGRKTREPLNPPAAQIRLFRFGLKHARKTLRIPLFQEELLNLPLRFTRRINAMELDNDVETDEEMAGSEAQRCQNWLKEAIAAQGHQI